jgi:hypothetical protein
LQSLSFIRFYNCSFIHHFVFHPQGLPYIPPQYSGCSAIVVVARGSRVTVGNVGNCRCVASRNGQVNDFFSCQMFIYNYYIIFTTNAFSWLLKIMFVSVVSKGNSVIHRSHTNESG